MNNRVAALLIILLVLFVGAGVYSNIKEQNAVDDSKLPKKVEGDRGFQRWITNLRNKDIIVEADEFRLVEKNEIYNTKWMKVYSIEDEDAKRIYDETLAASRNVEKIIFSPSDREFVDFRNIDRDGYKSNEVRFYGQKEDKIIDSRIMDCSVRANCYIDRVYFLDNDLFVVSELSRNIDKEDSTTEICSSDQVCIYTFKLHLVDLINNARWIYESQPFEAVLAELIPEL